VRNKSCVTVNFDIVCRRSLPRPLACYPHWLLNAPSTVPRGHVYLNAMSQAARSPALLTITYPISLCPANPESETTFQSRLLLHCQNRFYHIPG
jgi:hypothetical protein